MHRGIDKIFQLKGKSLATTASLNEAVCIEEVARHIKTISTMCQYLGWHVASGHLQKACEELLKTISHNSTSSKNIN